MIIDNDESAFRDELISHNNLCVNESAAGNNYVNNYYYQIRTTGKAMQYVQTKYVIKTRIDFYFENSVDVLKLNYPMVIFCDEDTYNPIKNIRNSHEHRKVENAGISKDLEIIIDNYSKWNER
jgi:tagatose-1,6-bisphosphate aldolase